MQNLLGMNIVQAHSYLEEELPYLLFRNGPVKLGLYVLAQIAAFAVLHDDIQVAIFVEGFVVFYHVVIFKLFQYVHLAFK
jgi:hypothetical protein